PRVPGRRLALPARSVASIVGGRSIICRRAAVRQPPSLDLPTRNRHASGSPPTGTEGPVPVNRKLVANILACGLGLILAASAGCESAGFRRHTLPRRNTERARGEATASVAPPAPAP